MTIEEVLKIIKDGRIAAIIIRENNEDETKFNQENIEALNVIVETMHKYQKIEKIIRDYDVAWESHHMKTTIDGIREVLEDGNDD